MSIHVRDAHAERLMSSPASMLTHRRTEGKQRVRPRGRDGCRTCRWRHLKCDETRPRCSNCSRAKRTCDWNHDIKIAHDTRSSSFNSSRRSFEDLFAAEKSNYSPDGRHAVLLTPSVETNYRRHAYLNRDLEEGIVEGEYIANIPETGLDPQAALQNSLEARLFQFYIDFAGSSLDVTSPSRHFARTIPPLALAKPVLFCACLAYASKAALPNSSLSEQYHNACIKLLIPLLSDEGVISTDETLLATLVLLRHVEQYSTATEDIEAHLLGAFGLVASQRMLPRYDSLPGTALWTYVRQDIRSALLNRSAPKLRPQDRGLVGNLDEVSIGCRSVFADRACHLAALACSFAWDDRETTLDGTRLEALFNQWQEDLPKDYLPYHASNGRRQFLAAWHVIGWQFYHLGKILLRLYNSTRPRDLDPMAFHAQVEADIVQHAQAITAIAYSTEDVGCRFNATAILGFAGTYLRDERERQRLLDFLFSFEQSTGWPTEMNRRALQQAWSSRAL